MDSLVSTAARALAAGDPLQALRYVALRDDPPALALRGIAMAQLGELTRARRLLGRAARAFGEGEPRARARCLVAAAEVALASRDLANVERGLDEAARLLAAHGDAENALFARLVGIRRLIVLGRVGEASRRLSGLAGGAGPPRLAAVAELARADIAARELRTEDARRALVRARRAALAARIPALQAEVESACRNLDAPAARLLTAGSERLLRLDEVAETLRSGELVVDGCRREVRAGGAAVSLVTRPVLFALALALAEHAPGDTPRETLIERAFCARRANESHRARLRVEIGRLRKALHAMADVRATDRGFLLLPRSGRRVLLLVPPAPGEASALLALLSGGEAWSTSALADALGQGQRSVQRALRALEDAGKVFAVGRGRAQRWVAPPSTGFATTLLLVAQSALR